MIISTRDRRTAAVLAVLALAGAAPPDPVAAPDELSLLRTIALPSDLGTGPVRLAIDPRRRRLFMATSSAATVDVIDEDTGYVRARIPAPAEALPVYRGSDDRLVVLSPGRAATYDGTTYTRIATTPFPIAVTAATFDASLGRLYVIGAHDGEKRLSAIDAVSRLERSAIVVGAHPAALVVDTYRPRIYVTDSVEHRVVVVDRWRSEIVRSWPLPSAGSDVVALDEDGQRLYVGGADAQRMYSIRTPAVRSRSCGLRTTRTVWPSTPGASSSWRQLTACCGYTRAPARRRRALSARLPLASPSMRRLPSGSFVRCSRHIPT